MSSNWVQLHRVSGSSANLLLDLGEREFQNVRFCVDYVRLCVGREEGVYGVV